MSIAMFFIIDAILLIAIGFFIWVYLRGSRASTLELVATQKIHVRNTEQAIMKMLEKKIAELDISEKRLNYLESRVDRLSGRSEKEIARRKRKQRSREDREYLGLVPLSEVKKVSGADSSLVRDAFEQDLLSQRMKLYAGQNA